jgi:hypothetical protein
MSKYFQCIYIYILFLCHGDFFLNGKFERVLNVSCPISEKVKILLTFISSNKIKLLNKLC